MSERSRASRLLAVLVTAGALTLTAVALAAPDDRAVAESLLKEVEASPKKDVAKEMVARSRAAFERSAKLRSGGDETRARLADGLARTWAESARDVLRAIDVEERSQAARRAATDAGAQAERERALLEEGIAQTGRIRAQVEAAERETKEQPARTSMQATADSPDGGAAKPAPKKDGGVR